jgi:hypothetical protein
MFKIDSSGNVAGLFTEGDPGLGQAPTVVSAEWLNAVQTEIVNVVLAAGLALNKADSAQLLAALRAIRVPTLLNPFPVYEKADMTFDDGWHTLTVAGVPSTAKWMYVGGWVMNQGAPDNVRQMLRVRPNNAGSAMVLSRTNGVAGSYENNHAIGPCVVPCDGAHLDYRWTDTVTDTNLIVYGYLR